MTWLIRLLVGLLALLMIAVVALYATGNGGLIRLGAGFMFGAPSGPYDPPDAVPAPDYRQPTHWVALPSIDDLADRTPTGIAPRNTNDIAPVDVFFIHPTGFLTGEQWISPMRENTKTAENTQWMLINQASAYNGCCNVYAPEYRQANIFAYFGEPARREALLAFAYQDVLSAFEHFLTHYNEGRPFIVASHSQGTHHGARLLRERIDGSPEAARLVAAYLIGGGLQNSDFVELSNVAVCDDALQTQCLVHWATYSERAEENPAPTQETDQVCVNPLTWKRDGGHAGPNQHVGAVAVSGKFQIDFFDDSATGMTFDALAAPIPQLVQAHCGDNGLYVSHQEGPPFDSSMGLPSNTNYHGVDYALFYMDIRNNAIDRSNAYLDRFQ